MSAKRVLLIGGCPRSGTTAAYHVFSAHAEACITDERYFKPLAVTGELAGDEFASAERFCDLRPSDSYPEALARVARRKNLRQRFEAAAVVGDKAPPLFHHFERIGERLPDAKFLILVRNPVDVAASYNRRAANPEDRTWPADKDWRAAITDWNDCLRSTLRAHDSGLAVLPVPYERLFEEKASFLACLDFIGLRADESAERAHANMRRMYLESIRPRAASDLDDRQRMLLLRNMDAESYDRVLSLFDG